MHALFQRAWTVAADESGQDLIEYALLAVFIGLGAVAAEKTLANAVKDVFTNIGSTLTSAT